MSIQSEFVAFSFIEGVSEDLKKSLSDLDGDIVELEKMLKQSQEEKVLLNLLIDYTDMLFEGAQGHKDEAIELIRNIVGKPDVIKNAQVIGEKFRACRAKIQEMRPKTATLEGWLAINPENIPDINSRFIAWAREDNDKMISLVCDSGKYKLEDLAYFAAYEEAERTFAKKAQKVLKRYFGDLMEEDKREIPRWDREPCKASPEDIKECFKEEEPKVRKPVSVSLDKVKKAALKAAEYCNGKGLYSSGKFSLRVFISNLEDSFEDEVDIDIDFAQQLLKECPSVAHCVGDIWMEVN